MIRLGRVHIVSVSMAHGPSYLDQSNLTCISSQALAPGMSLTQSVFSQSVSHSIRKMEFLQVSQSWLWLYLMHISAQSHPYLSKISAESHPAESQLYLICISAISQPYLNHISTLFQPYLSLISATSQPYLRHISALSQPPHLNRI